MPDEFAHRVRRHVLEQSRRAHVGHIGSALAISDLVALLYGRVLKDQHPDEQDRDRVVLSKGHAALALYAALHLAGHISEADLNTYCADDSLLGVHPEHALKGVDFSTGSLGQGLSIAAGAALAARVQGSKRRVFAIVSDAECNEGSIWEAVMFAAQHKLANLIAIVDINAQQAFGYTRDVLDLEPLGEKWSAFRWDVHEVDGHDVDTMESLVNGFDTTTGPPHVLLARTTFGRGVSYMESQIKWHYWPMSDEEYARALDEIEAVRS
ncbi:MAG TPA: 1-deoxy-D-xylulose-5-phosphate synthase N-terminal domain-containing protein [Candidatus Dormibacteraeota bacterium]